MNSEKQTGGARLVPPVADKPHQTNMEAQQQQNPVIPKNCNPSYQKSIRKTKTPDGWHSYTSERATALLGG